MIELLVVISIISLLTTILLPSLRGVKLYARRVVCGAHLKSIGTAWVMYVDEYPRTLPPAHNLPIDPGDVSMATRLRDYIESPEAWRCPSDDLNYFTNYKMSYEYLWGRGMEPWLALPEQERESVLIMAREEMDGRPIEMPVILDGGPFHPTRARVDRNEQSAYHDGHVDWFVAPEPPAR